MKPSDKIRHYADEQIATRWNARRCIHAAESIMSHRHFACSRLTTHSSMKCGWPKLRTTACSMKRPGRRFIPLTAGNGRRQSTLVTRFSLAWGSGR